MWHGEGNFPNSPTKEIGSHAITREAVEIIPRNAFIQKGIVIGNAVIRNYRSP
jgi:hypothetical protein